MRRLHLLLDLLAHWWHRATTSRYVLLLEARVRQLEADNLALRDTVFGLRGLPPVPRNAPAVFSVPTSQPGIAGEPVPLRPKVSPINPRRATDAVRDRKADNSVTDKMNDSLRSIYGAYKSEVEKEKDLAAGKGYAVVGEGITQVQDPRVPDSPAESEE